MSTTFNYTIKDFTPQDHVILEIGPNNYWEDYTKFKKVIEKKFLELEDMSKDEKRFWTLKSKKSNPNAYYSETKTPYGALALLGLSNDPHEIYDLTRVVLSDLRNRIKEDVDYIFPPLKKSNITLKEYISNLLYSYPQINIAPYEKKDFKNDYPTYLSLQEGEVGPIDLFIDRNGVISAALHDKFWPNLIKSRYGLTVENATINDFNLLKKNLYSYTGFQDWNDIELRLEIFLERLENTSEGPILHWSKRETSEHKTKTYYIAKTVYGAILQFEGETKEGFINAIKISSFFRRYYREKAIVEVLDLKSRTKETSTLFPEGLKSSEEGLEKEKRELESVLTNYLESCNYIIFRS